MAGRRPCAICRKWFRQDPRVKHIQKVCGARECQRERHRRSCAWWRRRNPDYDRENRLRKRLGREVEKRGEPLWRDPGSEIDWEVARDAIGLKAAVIIEESQQVLYRWARDAISAQALRS